MAFDQTVGLRISREPGAVPNAAQIGEGELAFNLTDGRVFALLAGAVVDITDGYTRAETDAQLADISDELAQRLTIANVVDTLTDTRTNRPLSANQGRVLRIAIDAINAILASDDTTLDQMQEVVSYIKANRAELESLSVSNIAGLNDALNGKVAKQTGKALSSNDYTTADRAKVAALGTMANRNIYVAERAPASSDGVDGDLWFQY